MGSSRTRSYHSSSDSGSWAHRTRHGPKETAPVRPTARDETFCKFLAYLTVLEDCNFQFYAASPSIHSAWWRRLACFESASGIARAATRPLALGIIRPKKRPQRWAEAVEGWGVLCRCGPGRILKLTSLKSVPSPTSLAALRTRCGHFAFAFTRNRERPSAIRRAWARALTAFTVRPRSAAMSMTELPKSLILLRSRSP